MDQSEDGSENPVSHENWMEQTNWKLIKYVIHHKHSFTPGQLKRKSFKESNEEEEEFTTSSEISEQDSEYDTTVDDTDESEPTETQQIHNVCDTTIHEDESSEEENVTEIEIPTNNGEQNNVQDKNSLLPTLKLKLKTKKLKGS